MSENFETKNVVTIKNGTLNGVLDSIKENESVQILAKDLKPESVSVVRKEDSLEIKIIMSKK